MKEAKLFTKKPITISAIKWTGDNLAYVIFFTDGRMPLMGGGHAGMKWEEYEDLVERDGLKIFTLEGKMNAAVGDYIIRGVKGELYPCKPDIFEMTYEAALAQKEAQQERIGVVSETWARWPDKGNVVVVDWVSDTPPVGTPIYAAPYAHLAVLRQALEALENSKFDDSMRDYGLQFAAIAAIREVLP